MRLYELKAGDRLKATEKRGECWHKDDVFTVHMHGEKPAIVCRAGLHVLIDDNLSILERTP